MRDDWQETEARVRKATRNLDDLEARLRAGEEIPQRQILKAMRDLLDAAMPLLEAVKPD